MLRARPRPAFLIAAGLATMLVFVAASRACRPSPSLRSSPRVPLPMRPLASSAVPDAPSGSSSPEVGQPPADPPRPQAPAAEPLPAREPSAPKGGTLRGVVRLAEAPPPPEIRSLADAPSCRNRHPDGLADDSLEVGADLGLRNAVVHVLRLEPVGPPPPAVGIALLDCRFRPRVVGLLPLQKLEIRNDDDLLHDVQRGGPEAFPMEPGTRTTMRCSGPRGPFRLACRLHAGELGWAVVLPNPCFAVTDADGAFRIEGIPPGEQTLSVWHERLRQPVFRTVRVEVTASDAVEIVLPVPR